MVQLPKGTRDFAPQEKIVRDKIVDTLKRVFELYGFSPFETPMFERFDVLSSKYTGGAEILKETFKLSDQGKRELALRYDLTVPLARFIAMNPMIKMPFRRYAIGEVFRDGPVSLARYRQFTQCDVDVVGAQSMKADAEIISLVVRAFKELGLDAVVRVNNRKILNDLLEYCGVDPEKTEDAILSVDKLDKFSWDVVAKELEGKGISQEAIGGIKVAFKDATFDKIKEMIPTSLGVPEMEEVLNSVEGVEFDVGLARGLAYYTSTIVEVVLKDSKVKSSVCGGGRYDKMIGSLIGKGDFPAMGVSFGLDRIYDALMEKEKSVKKTVSDVLIIPIGVSVGSVAEELRAAGIKVEVDVMGRSPSKNISYANGFGIPFCVFVGEEEMKAGKVKLKDMGSGKESLLDIAGVVAAVQKHK